MWDKDRNMQSLCEVCRRQQGTGNVAFFYGICLRGRNLGLRVEAWERKSAPSKDGGGGMQLAPERAVVDLGLTTKGAKLLCGRKK
jgi:hypothetical protein